MINVFLFGARCCSVIECNDLGVINGSCDPYVVVNLYNGLARLETKRTKIKKKTVSPNFDEVFHFDVSPRLSISGVSSANSANRSHVILQIPIRGQNHDRRSIKLRNGSISNFEFRYVIITILKRHCY